MLEISLLTAPLGLTEPLFVPAYRAPATVFDLALRTGFDLESLLFSFSVGGIASVLCERLLGLRHAPVPEAERDGPRHRFHLLALGAAPLSFAGFLAVARMNPIYAASLALLVGAAACAACRPDLLASMGRGGLAFGLLYTAFFAGLAAAFPGWVEATWRLEELSGVLLLGVPLEEILFAVALGFCWSTLYEHLRWIRLF